MRILIAEDDQVLADGLLRALRASGYAVDQVGSGSEADAALAAHEFDLVDPRPRPAQAARARGAAQAARSRHGIAGAHPDRGRWRRAARQGPRTWAPMTTWPKPFSLQELEARVRALTRRGLGSAFSVIRARPADLRRQRARGLHPRSDDRAVRARAVAAGGAAAARWPAGQQGSARGAPVRVGRRGEQQRDRGLHPPSAQEDRAGSDPHRHRARARLLPRKDRGRDAQAHRARTLAPPTRSACTSSSRREQRSLFGEILDWMLAPLLLLWPMSLGVHLRWWRRTSPTNRTTASSGEMARAIARRWS